MRIAICDDLLEDRQQLYNAITTWAETHQKDLTIREFPSGELLLEGFQGAAPYDLLFLDHCRQLKK